LQIPFFKGVSGTFLKLNRGVIVNRRFRKGEIICREGAARRPQLAITSR